MQQATTPGRSRVLIAIDWFLPAYNAGGPIQVVANLADALRDEFELSIVCGAYDLDRQQPLDGIVTDRWTAWQGLPVRYLERHDWNRGTWEALIEERQPDWIYLNGVFSPSFTLLPLRLARRRDVRIAIHPHGMFGPGALSVKPMKKRLFLTWARWSGFFQGVRWLATNDRERDEVLAQLPRAEVHVVPNLPAPSRIAADDALAAKPDDRWRFIAVGRVLPVKNLAFGVEALARVDSDRPIELHVFGPLEDAAYAERLPALGRDRVRVVLHGSVPGHRLPEEYGRSHYLLHPSRNENYGYAIVEALANGCPVICSDRTPWHDLADKNIGVDLPLKHDVWVRSIAALLADPPETYAARVRAAQDHFETTIRDARLVEQNRRALR